MQYIHMAYHNDLVAAQLAKLNALEADLFTCSTSVFTKETPVTKRGRFPNEEGIRKGALSVRKKLKDKVSVDTKILNPKKYYFDLGASSRSDFKASAFKLNPEYAQGAIAHDVYAYFRAQDTEVKAGRIMAVSMSLVHKMLNDTHVDTLGIPTDQLEKARDAYPHYRDQKLPNDVFRRLSNSNTGLMGEIKDSVARNPNTKIVSFVQYGLKGEKIAKTKPKVIVCHTFKEAVLYKNESDVDTVLTRLEAALDISQVTIVNAVSGPVYANV